MLNNLNALNSPSFQSQFFAKLQNTNFLCLNHFKMKQYCLISELAMNQFSRYWENLSEVSPHTSLRNGVYYYSNKTSQKLHYAQLTSSLSDFDHIDFRISKEFSHSSILKNIIEFHISNLPMSWQNQLLKVHIQQIRSKVYSGETSTIKTMNMFKNESGYSAFHLIKRRCLTGGQISLENRYNRLLVHKTFFDPLQTLVYKNSQTHFQMTPITTDEDYGYQDTLVINFDKYMR